MMYFGSNLTKFNALIHFLWTNKEFPFLKEKSAFEMGFSTILQGVYFSGTKK